MHAQHKYANKIPNCSQNLQATSKLRYNIGKTLQLTSNIIVPFNKYKNIAQIAKLNQLKSYIADT